jgi:hypothetical protein
MLDYTPALETSALPASSPPASDFSNLWLEWQVAQGPDELVSFDFDLVVKEPSPLGVRKIHMNWCALLKP